MAGLHVPQDALGVVLERLAQAAQAGADGARVRKSLIRSLLRYADALGRLGLSLLTEAGSLLERLVTHLLRLGRSLGALLLGLGRSVRTQLSHLGLEHLTLL